MPSDSDLAVSYHNFLLLIPEPGVFLGVCGRFFLVFQGLARATFVFLVEVFIAWGKGISAYESSSAPRLR